MVESNGFRLNQIDPSSGWTVERKYERLCSSRSTQKVWFVC